MNDQKNYKFGLRFYIIHPTIQLEKISLILPFSMKNGWSIGDQKKTPKGTIISNGLRDKTYWCYNESVYQQRNFFQYAILFYKRLIQDPIIRDFLNHITETQGQIHLEIHLFSNLNIGDHLSTEDLLFLSQHNIQLGLELFS